LNQLFATTLETLLNQALRLDSPSLQSLSQLAGKIIRVELAGLDIHLTLFPDNQGIIILNDYQGAVDVRINGAPFSLLHLFLEEHPLLANHPEITITGEINTAQQLLQLIKGLDIDWEEHLAQWVGDMPAHQLNAWLREGQDYAHERFASLQLNLTEYLQQETRYLPSPLEVEEFLNGADELRDDLARLEQRLQRLHQYLPA
jgi:ubiquinone biosynthesis protein UbiJ